MPLRTRSSLAASSLCSCSNDSSAVAKSSVMVSFSFRVEPTLGSSELIVPGFGSELLCGWAVSCSGCEPVSWFSSLGWVSLRVSLKTIGAHRLALACKRRRKNFFRTAGLSRLERLARLRASWTSSGPDHTIRTLHCVTLLTIPTGSKKCQTGECSFLAANP